MVFSDQRDVKALVYGAAFYGGGGGGSIEEGLRLAMLAIELGGRVEVKEPDEVPGSLTLITVSGVGAPAAREQYLKPVHLIRAVELLRSTGVEIGGIIPSEVGAFNGINGWLQSVVLKVPFVDIPCDGRAHPTGLMGSMGLHRIKGYVSIQAAAGGDPAKRRYIEVVVRGSIQRASAIIRRVAVEAGGLVAVARNPVSADHAKRNGAPGALAQAYKVGQAILRGIESGDHREACYRAFEEASGEVLGECVVEETSLETREGFDIGDVRLACEGSAYKVRFFNEYMSIEHDGRYVALFPDLIVVMDMATGFPLTSADLLGARNRKVLLGYVHRSRLLLGKGLYYPEAYEPLEKALGIEFRKMLSDMLLE